MSPGGVATIFVTPLKRNFVKNCLVKYCNFVVNLDRSLQGCKSDDRSYFRVFSLEGNPSLMRELYYGCVLSQILYSERGDCERNNVKFRVFIKLFSIY
jgi:hypothetical protein